jgi:hypothetical protein
MPYYSYKDIVPSFGASKKTLTRRLKDAGFKKQTPGYFFNEEEVRQIETLLNFKVQEAPKHTQLPLF